MRVIAILIFLIFSNNLKGQLSGSVYDKATGESLSYVNIWYFNDEISVGTTANESGSFKFDELDTSRFLNFNKVGYEVLKVKPDSSKYDVFLTPIKKTRLNLSEEVEGPRRVKKGIDFENLTSMGSLSTTESKPSIHVQYFPADNFLLYKLVRINLGLKNRVRSLINIRIYEATEHKIPGDLLYLEDLIKKISAGKEVYRISLKDLGIRIPENGIFIGYEKLIIDQNKIMLNETDYNTNQEVIISEYYPIFNLYESKDSSIIYSYVNGNWGKWKNSKISLGINLELKR
ncbi:carboxypeptidase-like regulatory domain-containing protein [uncultured Marivirga sp.]|uniref:carboxypeptidase-like regulatory domain-containing protein n=1 Tax=uncultured Marivirga sp. TaxID=1123707 RepID=UPI0030ED484A|tara:strand:+ start:75776 stop:76639 length:864 start_codon:yes stop_codon:yes gene_type:complete